jgi:lipopolysaccharide biosynthesis protein
MRPYQSAYDLFCHIHGKESGPIGFGNEWRKYLFDNLIKSDTAAEIIGVFEDCPDMGCIFPAVHDKVRRVMTDVGDPLYGSEYEYGLICDMLRRMGMKGELCLSELFFSAGTMMWYRPHALRQMFTCELRLEEFAEEPIGVGGTLAHAVERLPAVVAVRNGYAARSLTLCAP